MKPFFRRFRTGFVLLFLPIALVAGPGATLRQGAPEREVRAVWITTYLGLDWPKSTDRAEQQRSLRQIVRDLSLARYNTIYFQVRGRGDAMYRSLYEPWSSQLAGALGADPGWDPLEVLLREAHENGMEVHAWFNTYKVAGRGDRRPGEAPVHIVDRHPDWVRQADGEWWLDPGLPEVQEYLLRVSLDLVRNYDIDGIQFDFVRYPAAAFSDEGTYRRYGRGRSKEDWRRDNVTRFVAAFHDSASAVKPLLKLGASPLGIYRNNGLTRGLQSYDDAYQDSRSWLAKGYLDYLAPQVYWSLGDRPGNPDFARVAREWAEYGYGRHIVIGIAPYKPEVAEQLSSIIDVARASGAAGHAFFRYANVAGSGAVASRYAMPASIPPMAWKDAQAPPPLAGFEVLRRSDGAARISWPTSPVPGGGDRARVNVYRSERAPAGPGQLVVIRGFGAGGWTDSSGQGGVYALSMTDRAGNESELTQEAPSLPSAALLALAGKVGARFALGDALRDASEEIFYVPYEVEASAPVTIAILDERRNRVGSLVDDLLEPGRYVAAADARALQKGRYTVVMTAGSAYRSERQFLVE